MKMQWIVQYLVEGHPGVKEAGPYETREIAAEHMADIAGFEGVTEVRVIMRTVPDEA